MEFDPKKIKEKTQKLREEFQQILELYKQINKQKTKCEEKITQLKETYGELIKQNSNKVFLFCLDSLFFQYKVLNLEQENYNKTIALLHNRIYGDYYKLYNIVFLQCKENNITVTTPREPNNITMEIESPQQQQQQPPPPKSLVDFPIYKDIDPFFKYKLEDILGIHDRILLYIQELNQIYIEKENNIQKHREQCKVGFSLQIFLQTLKYEKELLKGQILLYLKYMEFYHYSQQKYLGNVQQKIIHFWEELNNIENERSKFEALEKQVLMNNIATPEEIDYALIYPMENLDGIGDTSPVGGGVAADDHIFSLEMELRELSPNPPHPPTIESQTSSLTTDTERCIS